MPRIRRRFLLDPAEIGVYHCIKGCQLMQVIRHSRAIFL